jgi:hypothetical protein
MCADAVGHCHCCNGGNPMPCSALQLHLTAAVLLVLQSRSERPPLQATFGGSHVKHNAFLFTSVAWINGWWRPCGFTKCRPWINFLKPGVHACPALAVHVATMSPCLSLTSIHCCSSAAAKRKASTPIAHQQVRRKYWHGELIQLLTSRVPRNVPPYMASQPAAPLTPWPHSQLPYARRFSSDHTQTKQLAAQHLLNMDLPHTTCSATAPRLLVLPLSCQAGSCAGYCRAENCSRRDSVYNNVQLMVLQRLLHTLSCRYQLKLFPAGNARVASWLLLMSP